MCTGLAVVICREVVLCCQCLSVSVGVCVAASTESTANMMPASSAEPSPRMYLLRIRFGLHVAVKCRGGGIMRCLLLVCVSVSEQDNSKSSGQISTKLGIGSD